MFHLFSKKNGNLKDDSLSGLTVALALVPEAIAFSFIAGVNPLVGLWAAVFMGFITAACGGRPGMISGATGAIAVVAGKAVQYGDNLGDGLGLQFLFAVIMVAGCIQILFGVLKLGRFIRLVPHPVMIGFVNGLAIVICMGQFGFFKKFSHLDESGGRVMEWMQGSELGILIGLIVLTMAIIQFFPKLTKAVPSTLVAIIVVGLIAYFGPDARTIENVLKDGGGDGTLSGSFPVPAWPSGIVWGDHWMFILQTAFVVAMVGIIESLMTLQLIDEITETRGQGNRECVAQGGANFLSGLFGGMGGCAMIGQSLINIKSGGRGRTSGIVAAVSLALFIVIGGPVIIQIPIAALVGVMFMVVIGTFEWSTFKSFGKIAKSEMLIILTVTLVTAVMHDLALAVFVGVILSALVFAWESSKHIIVTMHKDTQKNASMASRACFTLAPCANSRISSRQDRMFRISSSTLKRLVSVTFQALKRSMHSVSDIAMPAKFSTFATSPPIADKCLKKPAPLWTSKYCQMTRTTQSPCCAARRAKLSARKVTHQ